MDQCIAQGAEGPVKRVEVRRPARPPPLAGATPPNPPSGENRKDLDGTPGTTRDPLRAMLQMQVKRCAPRT